MEMSPVLPVPDHQMEISLEKLREYTNDFSQDNWIGNTQFGKVYRGIISDDDGEHQKHVTVKIWDYHLPRNFTVWRLAMEYTRMLNEVQFLEHPSVQNQLCMVKLIGYNCDKKRRPLGVVYDLTTHDTLENLILKDRFKWLQRLKVALDLARYIQFLHSDNADGIPYLVRNIDAAHVMMDENYNPKLVEFGMLFGGVLGSTLPEQEWASWVRNTPGYIDEHLLAVGGWQYPMRDVFSYGVLLLSLIAKRAVDRGDPKNTMYRYARKECEKRRMRSLFRRVKFSLVHESLQKHPDYDVKDGERITDLAVRCLKFRPRLRPTMNDIVECLESLQAVQVHGQAFGIKPNARVVTRKKRCFLGAFKVGIDNTSC